MQKDVYVVLDAIHRGDLAKLHDRDRWLDAFQTILWARKTSRGFVLTSDGQKALEEMIKNRRSIN